MQVLSNVPADEFDLANERPFIFTVQDVAFEIKPLSLHEYYTVERQLNLVLASLFYYSADLRKDVASLLKIDQTHLANMRNVENIITIIGRLIQPISMVTLFRLVIGWNWKHRHNRKRWVWSLPGWLEQNMSLGQVLDLSSWFMRYCGEYKKKTYQTLQKGIESITKFQKAQNQDISDFIDEGWKQGYQSVGAAILGLPAQSP